MIPTSTMRTLRGTLAFVAITGLPGGLLAAGTDDGHSHAHTATHVEGEAAQLEAGAALIGARQLYLDRCAVCHGPRGHGTDAATSDFADPEALVRLTHQTMSATLDQSHDGRLGAPLAEADRETIIGYLRNYLMLPAPDADTNIGRAIYSRDCSVCHGDRGDAASWAKNSLNPAPAAFTAHGLEQLSREKMIETVTFGSKNTAMMPFAVQLSHQEIAATVDYIRAAFMPEGMGAGMAGHDHGGGHDQGHDDHQEAGHQEAGHQEAGHQEAGHHQAGHDGPGAEDAPFPAGLIGNPVWGKAFYGANCAECHGLKGNGEGRRAYFMIVKPKDFLSREARTELVRPKLFEEISEGVTGTTMPSWEKVLTAQQIADVAEYVYRAFLHPDRFADIEVPAAPGWKRNSEEPAGLKKN